MGSESVFFTDRGSGLIPLSACGLQFRARQSHTPFLFFPTSPSSSGVVIFSFPFFPAVLMLLPIRSTTRATASRLLQRDKLVAKTPSMLHSPPSESSGSESHYVCHFPSASFPHTKSSDKLLCPTPFLITIYSTLLPSPSSPKLVRLSCQKCQSILPVIAAPQEPLVASFESSDTPHVMTKLERLTHSLPDFLTASMIIKRTNQHVVFRLRPVLTFCKVLVKQELSHVI